MSGAASSGPVGAPAAPSVGKLLDAALSGPRSAYRAHSMTVRWFGNQSRTEEADISWAPGDKYRVEYRSPDGTVQRVLVSDGEREDMVLQGKGKVLTGDAPRTFEKQLSDEDERKLLERNYKISVGGRDSIAGRKTRVLEIVPHADDRPSQTLAIDEETGAVLENRRFRKGGSVAALVRYLKFEPVAELPDALFAADTRKRTPHGLDPSGFLDLEDLASAVGRKLSWPKDLPGGFVFESGGILKVKGRKIPHGRYTDGLAVISLFETDRPVRQPKAGASAPAPSGSIRITGEGKVLRWQQDGVWFTLISDVAPALLDELAAAIRAEAY